MRSGFSLIVAIIFVVLISSLGVLSLSMSATTGKLTGDIFAKEQGEVTVNGFAEYVMLRILKHDFNNGCLKEIDGETIGDGYAGRFRLKADISYYGTIGKCKGATINTPQTQGTVMIEITATHIDTSKKDSTIFPVRIYKRLIQKI